ncbi:AzlC family ABC transporter permease [Acrocarpospora macrocephala]|uniref:Membrane protein n=1 Tax=Acrocarpospora macrocephala TaxID=150177 RepID=A0A5M3WUZ3_9ACTN|nr:AzlC family ABC transporter permease [Acrocarpospora macrocephala]GES12032.1 membrane protein [Acrocarpospora macrocephala]
MISYTAYRREFGAGMRAMTPWLVGVAPFGLVIGVSAAQADIPALAGWLTGPLIYAGSAQVATIEMLDAGVAPLTVIVTVLVINVRLILYSAAMAAYWRGTPLWWRLLAGYLLIDPSFVVGIDRYAHAPDRRRAHAHYLGGAVVLWVTWLTAIAVGVTAGARVPAWLHLEFLIPLYLIGQIVPKSRQAVVRRAVLVAGAVALLCLGAPMHLGVVAAIVAGVAAGSLTRANSAPPSQDAHP